MNTQFSVSAATRRGPVSLLHVALLFCSVSAGSAYGQSAMPPMPGMDHSSMPGRGKAQKAEPAPAKKPPQLNATKNASGAAAAKPPKATSAPEKLSLPKSGDAAHPHQMHPSQQPMPSLPVAQKKRDTPDLRPTKQYPRNADGSISIPGTGMAMADNDIFYMVLFDQLEYVKARDSRGMAWDAQAWVGRDYDKFWFKTEGERLEGATEGRLEGLWSHAFAAFWDGQLGIRHDFGQGPSRQWLAFGVQGIAPYWFDVEATGYVGPSGRTAARIKTEYTFRLSQVAYLSPELEADAYGKSDPARGIGSGLSDISLGLRLRVEIRREVAPYIGIAWARKLGNTADFARQAGEPVSERQVVAGVRVWF